MKIAIIAAVGPLGEIGRTSKACAVCPTHPMNPRLCTQCNGTGRIPCNESIADAYPEHAARVDELTRGHAVVMGRRTWEGRGAKPFLGRHNVIVSSAATGKREGAWFVRKLADAIRTERHRENTDEALRDLFVTGGATLFRDALPLAEELDLTLIGRAWDGDVRFPFGRSFYGARSQIEYFGEMVRSPWNFECVSREPCPTNADLTFTRWERR